MRRESYQSNTLTLFYSLQIILLLFFSIFFNKSFAGQAPSPISFASSPDAGKVVINEINVAQGYVELYFLASTDVNGWVLHYEGQGNNDGSNTVCSASPGNTCEYSAGSFLTIEGVSLHNTLEELLLLDASNLAIHYFRYANNSNQGGGNWEWTTDDSSLSTIYYVNGSKINLCTKPDGSKSNSEWGECDSTRGSSNNGETLHHIEIIHDGNGSTCTTETITIRACKDEACSSLLSSSMSLDFQVNGSIISSPSFTGTTTVDIDHILEETVTFSVANTSISPIGSLECDDASGSSCTMDFSSLGCPVGPNCSDIFPGDTTFGVNGGTLFFSFGDPSTCNGGSCTPAPTFNVPVMPTITPAGSFSNTALVDGKYEHTVWDLPWFSTVNFSGTGTAVIYFNQSITIPYGTNINPMGDPENVLIIVNGSITIAGGSTINANVYASGSATIGNLFFGTTIINGAFSTAGALSVWGEGTFNLNDSYIDNMDSKGFCNSVAVPSIDHFQIVHDGNGLTCEAETVTIKACTNAYDGSCTLSTDAVSLNVIATGAPAVNNNISFTGSTTTNLAYTNPETVILSIGNPSIMPASTSVCNDNSAGSCNLVFADAGFRFLNGDSGTSEIITTQTSGTSFPIRLQAIYNNNGVCEGLFTGNNNVNLSQENVIPDNTNPGKNFEINTVPIVKGSTPSSSVTLNFGTDSIATIPSPRYLDAGQIQLHASYSDAGINLVGSSLPFWVKPHQLVITETSGTTQKAGVSFSMNVTAYNSLGTGVDNITTNYSPGQLQLYAQRISPTLATSIDGTFTYSGTDRLLSTISDAFIEDISLANFSNGISTNQASYSEVGLIRVNVQDRNYGGVGEVVPSQGSVVLGRFTPDHFKQAVVNSGSLKSSCNLGASTFAYSGQLDEATLSKGTINYLENPVIEITAYNADDGVTKNYYEDTQGSIDDFMKMSASDVSILPPSADNITDGLNLLKMPISGTINLGTLSQNNLISGHADEGNALSPGVLHYKLSDNDHFYYQRSENAFVRNFDANFDITVSSITDSDSINAKTLTNIQNISGVNIRFGRLIIDNSFGPETENLPQIFKTEYYDGNKFVLNTDDQCTTYDVSKMTLSNISLAPTTKVGATGSFVGGEHNSFQITAPGVGNTGEMGVTYDSFIWLDYDWANSDSLGNGPFTENPTAIATFGLFRGNDRIISWREVGN